MHCSTNAGVLCPSRNCIEGNRGPSLCFCLRGLTSARNPTRRSSCPGLSLCSQALLNNEQHTPSVCSIACTQHIPMRMPCALNFGPEAAHSRQPMGNISWLDLDTVQPGSGPTSNTPFQKQFPASSSNVQWASNCLHMLANV